LQGLESVLSQQCQALAAILQYCRRRKRHVQIIERMASPVALPGLSGGARLGIRIA
jgi:hypothetical protein